MSTATMRETPCSCIVTPISCSAISIAILLWLMKRNCVPAPSRLTSLRVALGVGVVERRVDLVEQAERRRVQLEDREHQRDRGQRLLAARQQVDRAVLLARRLRHHLHAGIEDLVAGHHQPARCRRRTGVGNMRPKCVVDLVEGAAPAGRASRGRSCGSRPRACAIASARSAFCASRKVLRSRDAVSSSSAARLTAPSAAISR